MKHCKCKGNFHQPPVVVPVVFVCVEGKKTKVHTLISSSSLSQVTSGLGLPRVTQGNTALDSTRRVTLVGWRLICGSDAETRQEKRGETHCFSLLSQCYYVCVFLSGTAPSTDSSEIDSRSRVTTLQPSDLGRKQTYSSSAAVLRSSWLALQCRCWRCSSTLHCPTL